MRGAEAKLLGFIIFKTPLLHPAAHRLSFLDLRILCLHSYSKFLPAHKATQRSTAMLRGLEQGSWQAPA